MVLHPQPRAQAALPDALLIANDPNTYLPHLNDLMTYAHDLFAVYATAYG